VTFHATSERQATIGLPINFVPEATIALLKIQEGQAGKPVAVQVGQALDVPIALERGKSPHWMLTIPDHFELKTDEKEAALAPPNAVRPAPAQ